MSEFQGDLDSGFRSAAAESTKPETVADVFQHAIKAAEQAYQEPNRTGAIEALDRLQRYIREGDVDIIRYSKDLLVNICSANGRQRQLFAKPMLAVATVLLETGYEHARGVAQKAAGFAYDNAPDTTNIEFLNIAQYIARKAAQAPMRPAPLDRPAFGDLTPGVLTPGK